MDIYKLDVKDIKILAELDFDARQSNSKIGKKVGLSKEVVKYRIDRLIEKGVVLRFNTIINYFKLGIRKYKLYLRLTNVNKEKIEEIAQYFNEHKKTEWVVTTTGRWDMIIGFLVHNVNELDDEIQNILNKFSKHIQEKEVTTTLYLAHQVRKFLLEKGKKMFEVAYHTAKDPPVKIDDTDHEILKILTNNARMPVTEVAKMIKTTPRVVQYRIKELEKKKVILAYKMLPNPQAMGRIFCKVIMYLSNPTKAKLNSFINYASSFKGAVWPQRVIGTWDFELDLELESYDEFQNIILDLKEKFPDIIRNHEFCIVSKEYKLDFFPGCYPTL